MITLLLALVLGAPGLPEARDVGPLADLRLVDQYGREDSLEAYRGQVVLVMVVHAKRLRKLRSWEAALRGCVKEVHYLRIADVPADPPVTREEVAKKLRERVPKEVSILADLDRRWAKTLGLDTGQPNLLVFDRGGRLVGAYRGDGSPALEARVCRDLQTLTEAGGR